MRSRAARTRALAVASQIALLAIAYPAAAQTLFTTPDYRQDNALWADPAYYRNNTVREVRDMQEQVRFGEEGSGADHFDLHSPYPFRTSEEHYQAWLDAAGGGTTHTLDTLPDWNGRWGGDEAWLGGDDVQVSTIAGMLTPQYREYFVQQAKAESEGRHFWPASFCLPRGFIESIIGNPKEFILRPDRVWIIGDTYTQNLIRWVYTDGSGHAPEEFQFPQWHGESIGFWDGDALVVHTNQVKSWKGPVIEWSDSLTTVERYRRVGDMLTGEITMYDPAVFVEPMFARFAYPILDDDHPVARPIYNTCTDTNGPSSNLFINAEGALDERGPGDPRYWDPTDLRPWGTFYSLGE